MDEPTCSVDGCSRPPEARGMCGTDWMNWRRALKRAGLPLPPPPPRRKRNPESRFLEKVDKNGPLPEKRPELGPCWVWTGAKMGSGYGHFVLKGRSGTGAHVVAYTLFRKPVPTGLELDHLCHPGDGTCLRATCRHILCVNPDHLEPVTRLENIKRGHTFVAAQMAKTHCPKGHPYDEENTRIRIGPSGNEMRSCKQCHRDAHPPTGKINAMIAANAAKTHCPQGHEYTPENTIVDYSVGGKNGGRRCRACRNERQRQRYQSRKTA